MRRTLAMTAGVVLALVVLTACGAQTLAEQQQRPPTWTELFAPVVWWVGPALLILAIGIGDRLSQRRKK